MQENRVLTDSQKRRAQSVIWPWLATLLRAAQCMTHDQHEAEDLVSETVIKAIRAIDRLELESDPRAWLLTILRRTRIDAIRSRRTRPRTVSIEAGDGFDPPDRQPGGSVEELPATRAAPEALLEKFSDADLIAALRRLPEEMRWTLLLVDVEQLDHAEAAAILNVPVGTVKSRSHRARAMLRGQLWRLPARYGWRKEGVDHES